MREIHFIGVGMQKALLILAMLISSYAVRAQVCQKQNALAQDYINALANAARKAKLDHNAQVVSLSLTKSITLPVDNMGQSQFHRTPLTLSQDIGKNCRVFLGIGHLGNVPAQMNIVISSGLQGLLGRTLTLVKAENKERASSIMFMSDDFEFEIMATNHCRAPEIKQALAKMGVALDDRTLEIKPCIDIKSNTVYF